MYIKYKIREMVYVIRDLKENSLVIRDREPPLPPCMRDQVFEIYTSKWEDEHPRLFQMGSSPPPPQFFETFDNSIQKCFFFP